MSGHHLTDRVEEATGPDRELDCRIGCAFDGEDFDALIKLGHAIRDFVTPAYTASLDAAMTLVPEGWEPLIDGVNAGGERRAAWIVELYNSSSQVTPHGSAATPALALTAAALRAIAHQKEKDNAPRN